MSRHSIHHLVLPTLLAIAVAQPATAQTPASVDVVRGCLQAAPRDSLRPQAASPIVFRQNAQGIFVVEIESAPPASSWTPETNFSGFAGSSYYRWNGRNQFNSPGNGVLTYGLWCDQPDRYRLQMHNRHEHHDSSEENDCWMSLDGASWRKIYSNDNRNARVWNWHTRVDPGHGWYEFNLTAGYHELRISGRSANFMIDRFHVFPRDLGRVEDLQLPQSDTLGERPIIGGTIHLQVGDPHDEANLPRATTSTFLLFSAQPNAANPCGLQVPGMGADGGMGEFLLSTRLAPELVPVGFWRGPNQPRTVPLRIPNRAALVGTTVHVQGLFAALQSGGLRLVLTDRVDLHLGDS